MSADPTTAAMPGTVDALALAYLLDRHFEFVANTYMDAYEAGGGLQEVIDALREVSK